MHIKLKCANKCVYTDRWEIVVVVVVVFLPTLDLVCSVNIQIFYLKFLFFPFVFVFLFFANLQRSQSFIQIQATIYSPSVLRFSVERERNKKAKPCHMGVCVSVKCVTCCMNYESKNA